MEDLLSSIPAVSELPAGQETVEQTRKESKDEPCVHRLFELQAERAPHALAVIDSRQQLTYGELNERAEQLAHCLHQLGVTLEVPVAVCLERSAELVIALLAVLKAGGAYLPLEPTHPHERLEFMLRDAAAPVLLIRGASKEDWAARFPF